MHAAARARAVATPSPSAPRPPLVCRPLHRRPAAACNERPRHATTSSSSSSSSSPLLLRVRRPRFPSHRNHAAANGSSNDSLDDAEIQALLRKYDAESPKPSIPPRAKPSQPPSARPAAAASAAAAAAAKPDNFKRTTTPASAAAAPPAGNGTFFLCFLCLAVYLADNLLHLPGLRSLYLVHGAGALASPWWTLFSHAFAHASWQHLSANLFPLLVFGKLVEETEGAGGVVLSFLLTAAGAALASVWLTPGPGAVVSVGASGAVFGLFSIAVLTRFSADPRRLLEFFVLGQFVVSQVLGEARAQAAGGTVLGGLAVSHVAHLAGAMAGVLLVMLLRSVPEPAGGGE